MGDWDVASQGDVPPDNQLGEWDVVSHEDTQSAQPGPWDVVAHGDDTQSTAVGAGLRGLLRGTLPTLAAVGAGSLVGGAVGAAAAPLTTPVGGAVAGAAAGLTTGAVVGGAVQKGQDWLADKLGLDSPEQRAADEQQQPYISEAANLAPAALALQPGKLATPIIQRLLGAGLLGGANIGQQYVEKGSVDPTEALIAGAAGGAFVGERPWMAGLSAKARGAIPGRPGVPNTPEAQATEDQIKPANDITMTAPGVAAENVAPSDIEVMTAATPMGERSAREYPKDNSIKAQYKDQATQESVPLQLGDGPSTDVAAALQAQHPENEAIGVGNQQGVMRGDQPETSPQAGVEPTPNKPPEGQTVVQPTPNPRELSFEEAAPIQTGIAEQAPRIPLEPPIPPEVEASKTVTEREAAAAQNGRKGQLNEPLTPEEEAAPERKAAPQQKPEDIDLSKLDLQPLGNKQGEPNISAIALGNEPVLTRLRKMGGEWAGIADQIDKMAPDDRARAIAEATKQLPRVPQNRPTLAGSDITGRSPADVARKQSVLDATKSAFAKFGEAPANETNGALLDRVKSGVDHAIEQNGGKSPTDRAEGYAPRIKPTEWQWVKAAQGLLKKPTPANIDKFKATEELLRGGGASDTQATKRIEADIEKSPRPSGELADAAGAAPDTGFTAREDFDMLPEKTGGDLSLRELQDQNKLRNWVNNLDDVDYRLLENRYPEGIRTELETTQDPEELHRNMVDDLAEAQTKRPGVIEYPAEDMTAPPRVIKNRADLAATEPGAKASEGRSRKDLIAEYNAKLKAGELPGGNKLSPEERIASEQAAAGEGRSPEKPLQQTQQPQETPEERDARRMLAQKQQFQGVPNSASTYEALRAKAAAMMGGKPEEAAPIETGIAEAGKAKADETSATQSAKPSGLSKIPAFFKELLDPTMTPSREVSEALGNRFNQHVLGLENDKSLIRANTAAAPELTPEKWKEIYKAQEDKTTDQLPPELRKAYDDSVLPVRRERLNDLQDLMDLNKANPWLDMKLPKDLDAGLNKDHVPRLREGKQIYDADKETNINPLNNKGRNLTLWNGALEKRDYVTLDDGKGMRLVVQPGDGKTTVYRNGQTTPVKTPASFEGNPGDTISMKIKGQPHDFTVDHATADEITQNVKTPTGEPVKYIQNPVMAESQQFLGTRAVLRNAKVLVQVNKDQRFLANSTTDKDVANERGYIQTKLPQFARREGKDLYMDPRIAWAMDDFVKPGFNDASLDPIRNASTGLMNTMFVLNPIVHPLNEANLWATSRGFRWVQPKAYRNMVETGWDAMKSVWTQDEKQAYYRDHGANLILPSVLNANMIKQMGAKFGYEAQQNPSLWDPITKSFGVSVPDVARWMNKKSQTIMWGLSDMLATQRIMENEREGMLVEAAIQDAHKFISSYRVDTTMLGSRTLQKAITDPAVSFFGRYHGGLWNTYGHLAQHLANGTKEQRVEALGQVIVGAAITGLLYPLMDKAYQSVTGNDQASVGRRGFSTIPGEAADIYNKGADVSSLMGNAWTPSLPIKLAVGAVNNTDPFTGKKIVQAGSGAGHNAVQEAEWMARNAIPPLNSAESVMNQPGAKPTDIVQKLAEDQFGLKNPSDTAQKYLNRREHMNTKAAIARYKKPPGVLEEVYDKLMGR